MGPLKMAHLNGLSVSRQPMYSDTKDEPERASNDERVGRQQPPVLGITPSNNFYSCWVYVKCDRFFKWSCLLRSVFIPL